MTLIYHKCIVLFSVLFTTLISGIAPWFVVRYVRKQGGNYDINKQRHMRLIFSCLNMFSGGVFLGVCFMHLLPEVKRQMAYCLLQLKYHKDFPATEFLVVIGFFIVVIIEIIVSQYMMNGNKSERQLSKSQGQYNTLNKEINVESASLTANRWPDDKSQYGAVSNTYADNEHIERTDRKSIASTSDQFTPTDSCANTIGDESEHDHLSLPTKDGEETVIRSMLLFLALSLHTVFDGLSLGLQEDLSQLYSLFTAVIIHKILIGFTLGLQIFGYSLWSIRRSIMLMFLFACISPAGMIIGICIGRIKGHELIRTLTSAILNGLATGTFVYVTFIEILGRELAKKGSIIQIFFAIAGFGLMTGLVFYE